jgi:hypothetical protein
MVRSFLAGKETGVGVLVTIKHVLSLKKLRKKNPEELYKCTRGSSPFITQLFHVPLKGIQFRAQ